MPNTPACIEQAPLSQFPVPSPALQDVVTDRTEVRRA
ncbi:hypothetical protein GO304_04704 [Ralstonia solanacearum]|nr:hypothetical protein [Ralstonia solanacearum]NKA72786.1 hypothetical protein [Ralstonia solanacearum]NKF82383.1 hypothetical protein [Ralstonia solanacearum]